jgi:flagellin
MTVINSNSAAMLTANSINQNDRAMTSTMERLSTGKRINSAADDAAGLAIATKMTSQIRGLDQAGRNANNATSMVQLADGAAEQVSNILQRMREIVVQAADGSNSASDVAVLNVEFKEAASEVDRIVDSTEFNGKKLLDGSAGGANSSVTFQIGANASQTLTVDFSDFNLNAGGTANAAAVTTAGSTSAAGVLTYALDVTSQTEGEAIKLGDVSYEVTGSETDNTALVAALNASSDSSLSQFTFSGTTTVIATADTPATTGTVTASTLDNIRVVTGPMEANLVSFSTTGMGSDFDAALNNIDNAISGVATQRATFGATMNRLEYAVDNLASASLATATARGRIEDANYATETTALARSQIIAQAGTAMLAQANQKSQSVLSLLQ